MRENGESLMSDEDLVTMAKTRSITSITGSSDEEAQDDIEINLLDPIKLSMCQEAQEYMTNE